MTASTLRANTPPVLLRGRGLAVLGGVLLLSLALSACGDKKKDKGSTQAVARVNSEEITVHQVNMVLEQQRGLPPAQAASASRQILSRLIDQQLAVQEAQNQKLDRDPRVVRQIEAAKREIIARAYAERVGSTVARPSPEEIKAYYDANPALFKERRVYNIEEISIEAKPDQIEGLKTALQAAKDVPAFTEHLRSAGFKFGTRQLLTPAEQMPLDRLDRFAQMKEGQTTFAALPMGAQVMVLLGSRLQPVEEEAARPAIEQFLSNDRRHKAIVADIAALRAAAKIEYLGEFAADAKQLPPVAPTDAAPPSSAVENALKGLK